MQMQCSRLRAEGLELVSASFQRRVSTSAFGVWLFNGKETRRTRFTGYSASSPRNSKSSLLLAVVGDKKSTMQPALPKNEDETL
ncbi:unnamed protein product [Leptosia nina]|uniref:Uncharacterized protein n=1 Tax=Leptosia nina TaxID=320188 RepID=A0AAV1K4K1_9NEOP